MPRFWTTCLAFLLVPLAAAGGTELKPKLGDIGGASYSEVSERREVCRHAVEGRIALCRLNTGFENEAENRDYAPCLRVFEWQAESCAEHFRRQAGKCDGRGPARIEAFTGFGCTVAATGDESGEPAVAPVDRAMQVRMRTDIRSGPGPGHARVGALEAGREVRVTGEAGAWLRIEAPDGGPAFVHASRLAPPTPRDPAADRAPICLGMSPGAACWHELADPPGCRFWYDYYNPALGWVWSGSCPAGVAEGPGALAATSAGREAAELIGAFGGGRMQGLWIVRYPDGRIDQGPYVDGRKHGRWIDRYADGRVDEGSYANGMKHGRWVDRYASGNSLEYEYRDGSLDGQPGVYITGDGERRPGRWSGDCFLGEDGRLLVRRGDRKACPPG